jgi:hypothetical protein
VTSAPLIDTGEFTHFADKKFRAVLGNNQPGMSAFGKRMSAYRVSNVRDPKRLNQIQSPRAQTIVDDVRRSRRTRLTTDACFSENNVWTCHEEHARRSSRIGLDSNLHAGANFFRRRSRPPLERRAVGAVIWGTPAVNTDLMRQEMLTKTWIQSNGKLCGKKRFQVMYFSNPRFGDAVIDVTSYPAHQNEDQEDDDHQA